MCALAQRLVPYSIQFVSSGKLPRRAELNRQKVSNFSRDHPGNLYICILFLPFSQDQFFQNCQSHFNGLVVSGSENILISRSFLSVEFIQNWIQTIRRKMAENGNQKCCGGLFENFFERSLSKYCYW